MTDSSGPTPSYEPAPTYPPPSAQVPVPLPVRNVNTLAILSLVSAFFVSVVAVVLGHISLAQIKRTGDRGRPVALSGVIVGYAGIAFWSIAIVSVVIANALGGLSGLDSGGTASGDLTFEAGRDVAATANPQISDGLIADEAWARSGTRSSDTWGYVSTDHSCSAIFHEGPLEGVVQVKADDDLATTDSYLAQITGASDAEVADDARDDYLGLGQPEDNTYVDTRGLSGTTAEGKPYIVVARAFAGPQKGISISISCETKSKTTDAYQHVRSATGVLVGT